MTHEFTGSAHGDAPIQLDQEWANAWTHGIGAALALFASIALVVRAWPIDAGLALACGAYGLSTVGVFVCSTLSHVIFRQPLLNTLRAWDQAMIYTMISGTYTPITYAYAPQGSQSWLLAALWIAAGAGFAHKVFIRHRINSIGTISYLLLGWLPAVPLVGQVPGALVGTMLIGGVIYTIGVVFLMNDSRLRYLHAVWHLFVVLAASCHFYGIWYYVVEA